MKRAAIIVYGNKSNKIMFWIFGRPFELGKVNIKLNGEDYEILIFEIPYAEYKHKMKQKRIIDKFCGENNIQSVFYIDDVDEQLESYWNSIKVLCILSEIEAITQKDFFNQSFGIVCDTLNPILLEAISKEASSITVFKEGLDVGSMENVYKRIIHDRGLSIAFVNDMEFLIKQSKIVLWDSLRPILPSISEKGILVLTQPMDRMQLDSVQIKYKDQIAKVIISFMINTNIWEIAAYFPFVYFLDEHDVPMSKNRIHSILTRSNNTLTIQKC